MDYTPDTSLRDKGRAIITGRSQDEYTFKVPGLRNIVRTYPYMHDGRFRTLEQVLEHYSKGDFYMVNTSPELLATKDLSSTEKKEIIAFLKTLTDDESFYMTGDSQIFDIQMIRNP